ncbi:MAG: hypothetical protein BZY88_18800 [SAR202 cluster bacterium Io17-Chloro-G9]|nr:MAG: hypothetical protein BZY88_18800 [SAR202 cluster bacterium Io17-Chloro-G9]
MKYGFTLPGRGPLATPENMGTIARHGEELGYDCLLTGDHILVPRDIASTYPYSENGAFPGSGTGESMEQLTVLSFLAGQTKTIRLGTSVMIVPHRNPLVAAKALATLDVLSQGRVILGVGVGWMREEFQALGIPPFEERGAVTDEYIQAFKELWTSDNPSFQGQYCQFDNIDFLPKPVQKPHPPIWVGGESRSALGRTARLGDAWCPLGNNPQFPMGEPEQLAAGMERLARYARREGRDPADIEVVYRIGVTEEPDRVAGDIRRYAEMGISQLIVGFGRQANSLDEMLSGMDDFARRVWPLV